MEKLIIIDGNSILNRAFYALPVLSVNGVYSNAVYGFANMLIKAITEIKPRYCVVAFDVKSPTFRHELYKDYKATRKGMPAELASQLPIVKQMLDVMNIKVLEKAGLEADDVIGTLSKRFKTQKIIVTGDKDCLQLVDPTTEVYLTKKGLSEVEIVDVAALNLKWKTSPSQFIDLKALMGDTSDNIPGCAGVGEKTAQELITLYGSIDGIYKNIDKITGKLKEKLEVSKDNVYLSFKLSAINTNVDIDCLLHECELKYPFGNQVYSFFEKYSFKSLLKRTDIFSADVFGHTNQEEVIKEVPTIALKNLDIIKQSKTIAIVESADVFVALDNTKNYKLEIKKDLISNGFDYSEILDAISGKDAIVFDKKKMLQKGYKFKNVVGDAKIANFLLTNNTGVIEKPSSFFDLPQKIKDFGLEELYNNIELPLTDVLTKMENDGFKIDFEGLEKVEKGYNDEIAVLRTKICALAGEEFNINSTQQLANVLFNKLNLKPLEKTKSGFSTGIEVLERLKDQHGIIPLIIRYRKITKLQSVYIVGFKNLADSRGLIHTTFNQTGTITGRLSSSEPNMQNIPVRSEEGRALRKLFVSRFNGGQIISADYSQIELRLLAHLSGDENLTSAFRNNQDIHTATAQRVFGTKNVDENMRRDAKAINFGIIYGISAFGLSENLNCTPSQAQTFINLYFEKFPTIKTYLDNSVKSARELGYAITIFNRRRYIEELNNANKNIANFGSRVAMNMPCQGSASDIIKKAMVQIDKALADGGYKTIMLLQVHDELVFDSPADEVEKIKVIIKNIMENVVKLDVPLVVDIKSGSNLFEAK